MNDRLFVRTVLGDVTANAMGACYAHEHIVIGSSFVTLQYPEFALHDVDKIAEELRAVYAMGVRTMVDSMPCGGGRDVLKLAEISRRTGMQIVCPTGLHLRKYYPPGHWSERLSAEAIARVFSDEIEHGIDANDTNGPAPDRTPHRAGLIKVASSLDQINDFERKVFEAAAIAQRTTGCAILTHTEQGTAAIEQVELFANLRVAADHLVLSHTDRKPDLAYHREILSTGAFLEYDSAFRWKGEMGNPTRTLIEQLCADGFGGQIVVGMDAARSAYWRSYGGHPGLPWLVERFFPEMIESGFPESSVHQILVDNPARAYARFHSGY